MRMTDEPEYQHTATPDTGQVMLLNCKACGAVVVSKETHTEWHREILNLLNRSITQSGRIGDLGRAISQLGRV